MKSLTKNAQSAYRLAPLNTIKFGQAVQGQQVPLRIMMVDNLDKFGEQYGERAMQDLKRTKSLKFYDQGSPQTCQTYLLAREDPTKDLKPLEMAASLLKTAKGLRDPQIQLVLPESMTEDRELLGKLVYGSELANYNFKIQGESAFEDEDKKVRFVDEILFENAPQDFLESEEFQFYNSVGRSKNFARKLANARLNHYNIQDFIQEAKNLQQAHSSTVSLTVLEDKQLLEQGMNLNYAVGQGSYDRPAFINLTYKGDSTTDTLHSIVGKGVVFDTGGLNIKPTGAMEDMYMDKGGASSAMGTFRGIVELGLKVNVTCSIPLAENSVSSNSYRPSDIITSMKGITVEIGNTDAEGRLILADAMTWTQRNHNITSMVEMSTLTGACLVALGKRTAGLFSNDGELNRHLVEMGETVGEPLWHLPIPDEIREVIKSDYSDINNTGKDRWGGSSVAAAFLEQFVEDGVKWAHLDIAGPACADKPYGAYTQGGCTGFGVATLMQRFRKMGAGESTIQFNVVQQNILGQI